MQAVCSAPHEIHGLADKHFESELGDNSDMLSYFLATAGSQARLLISG